ncbi:MAG: LysM peptidoglycan-binding domain-containing protein [Bacteroidia bacterium]|nr:LysM peptidoglycan-binding domain-containing protein [Bacteroidia bacterium]
MNGSVTGRGVLAAMLLVPYLVQAQAPERMQFCGMDLALSPGARTQIDAHITQIQASPRYFNEMVRRAYIYMPFIEEALQNAGVPDDLKYMAIQESSLRPDAVSSSNAVGFWQFKTEAASEVGLRISELVDERRHIFRSSESAGRYLFKMYEDFDNWLYAVIAYYEGGTGAVKHTDPAYYGAAAMPVTENTHWYALKVLAHKLAFEEALGQRRRPEVTLTPYPTQGETSVRALIERHQADPVQFMEYNKWIVNEKKLPKNSQFTYYIPLQGEAYSGHIPDPTKVPGGGVPDLSPGLTYEAKRELVGTLSTLQEPPPAADTVPAAVPALAEEGGRRGGPDPLAAQDPAVLDPGRAAFFELRKDLHYGIHYVMFEGNTPMTALADRQGVLYSELLVWNGLVPGQEPEPGTLLYLDRIGKQPYHIVRPGERLADIAARRALSPGKIQKRNRMPKASLTIYTGQKLYLTEKKPAGEPVIILTAEQRPAAEPVRSTPPAPPAPRVETPRTVPPAPESAPAPAPGVREVQTRWLEHTVKTGETLWSIAKQYNTKVEIIKQINKLSGDQIHEGQRLRILARE